MKSWTIVPLADICAAAIDEQEKDSAIRNFRIAAANAKNYNTKHRKLAATSDAEHKPGGDGE